MSSNPENPTIPMPYKCGRYGTAHDIHHIRALRSANHGEWFPATNLAFDGPMITFDANGAHHRGWNHDTERLKALISAYPDVEWSPRYTLLRFKHERCGYLVGIGDEYDRNGCYSDASEGGYFNVNAANSKDE